MLIQFFIDFPLLHKKWLAVFSDDAQDELNDYEDFGYAELQFVTVQLPGHVTVERDDDVAVVNVEMYAAGKKYLNDDEIAGVNVVDVDGAFGFVDGSVERGVVVADAIAVDEMDEEVDLMDFDAEAEIAAEIDFGIVEVDQVVEDVDYSRKSVKRLLQMFL